MLGPLLVFPLLAVVCAGAIWRPAIGVIGYYGFVLLMPEWNWRWSLPPDLQYQKYIALSTLLGLVLSGLRGNRLNTAALSSYCGLGSFMLIAIISAQFSIFPTATAFYMDYLWKVVLMAFITVRVIDSPRLVSVGFWSAILAQAYNAYQVNLDYLQRGVCIYAYDSPWGNKGDNNLYSILTLPVLAMSAASLFGSRSLPRKLVAGAIFTLQLHQIMLFQSRGSMLGGLAMAPVLLWLMPKTRLNWLAVATATLIGTGLAGPSVVEEFTSSLKHSDERDTSAESRFKLWKAGAQITADHPLLGVGPYAGQAIVRQYMEGETLVGAKGLHNLFFEISTGCGVPALLFYLWYFALAWWTSVHELMSRESEPLPEWAEITYIATASGLVGYFAASMFSSGALLETSYMLAAYALATRLVLQQHRHRDYHPYLP